MSDALHGRIRCRGHWPSGSVGRSADATPGDTDTTYNPIAGCRLTDTRGPDNIGPRSSPLGANDIYEIDVHGSDGECTGPLAIPTHATGIAANVTAVGATTSSNLRLYPADLTEVPLLSNLDVTAGAPPTPNLVNVQLSPDGAIKVYNFRGNVDIVSFYTPQSLTELVAAANTAAPGVVEMSHGFGPDAPNGNVGATVGAGSNGVRVETSDGCLQVAHRQITGPASKASTDYALTKIRYCINSADPGAFIEGVRIFANTGTTTEEIADDDTNRSTAGCYDVRVVEPAPRQSVMLEEWPVPITAGCTPTSTGRRDRWDERRPRRRRWSRTRR